MVLIIIVLLLCARGTELKIVYSRPVRNDTPMAATTTVTEVTSTEADDDEVTFASTRRQTNEGEDNSKSMSSKSDYYGIQYYAPPVIHGTAAAGAIDLFGRPLRPQQHQHQRHQPASIDYQRQYHHRTPWDPTVTTLDVGDGGPLVMNHPLLTGYDEPSTPVQYSATPSVAKQHRGPQPVARLIKYTTEPAAAALPFQLPFLVASAAEADDGALLDSLPALQLAMQQHLVTKQPSAQTAALHQLYHHHHQPRLQSVQHATHRLHHHGPNHHRLHHHQRYGGSGVGAQSVRYTQVPFLYSLPAPPVQRQLAPSEYELVTRFNRLLKQREREDDRRDAPVTRRRPHEAADGGSRVEEEEETATRPAVKTKKAKKKQRKKKKTPTTPVPPAPVEEEHDEEDDGQRQQQVDDERAEDEPSEEQETQHVHTKEQLPEGSIIQEPEVDIQNSIDESSQLSEQLGGDMNFEDGHGERVEFQLHGLGGPEAYKFGFDTGKGTNRQFRYEERDTGGNVRGHYGYLDHDGKMQVYNYSSHPELGFNSQKAETLEV